MGILAKTDTFPKMQRAPTEIRRCSQEKPQYYVGSGSRGDARAMGKARTGLNRPVLILKYFFEMTILLFAILGSLM